MKKKLSGLLVGIICLSFTGMAFALTPLEKLGKRIYEDPAYSVNGNQSCQSCHHPKAEFSDPVNRISPLYRPVSEGSIAGEFGGRNAPPAAYAAYSPPLHWNLDDGLFIGGLFWDGRATGRPEISGTEGLGAGATGDPLADQAKGPFGNPVEMGLVDGLGGQSTEQQVVGILKGARYRNLYNKAFVATGKTETKIKAAYTPDEINEAYNNIALAISAFEKSRQLNKFNSKFDIFRQEQMDAGVDVSTIMIDPDTGEITSNMGPVSSKRFTQEEIEGLALFNTEADSDVSVFTGGGGCFLCHPVPSNDASEEESVFTDFSYDNLGVPQNPVISDLGVDQTNKDIGLQSQKDILKEIWRADNGGPAAVMSIFWNEVYPAQRGKHKVSSLRNVARTAPYGHNGFFPTLYDIVHFYNTRDVADWPNPEVWNNVNDAELGNLGLTFEEEQKIVVFLETLTDK